MECKGKHKDRFVRCGGGTYICPVCHNKGCLSEKCSNNAFSSLGGKCLSCGAFGKHMLIEKYERQMNEQSKKANKQSSKPSRASDVGIGFGLGFLAGRKKKKFEEEPEDDYQDDFNIANRYDNEEEEEE